MLTIRTGTTEGRRRALREFLQTWYGLTLTPATGAKLPVGCPVGLAEWWSILSAHPQLKGAQNQLVGANRLEVDPFVRHAGSSVQAESAKDLWVFYVENQGVFVSACESVGDDPPVWTKSEWSPRHADSWKLEAEPLSGCLLHAVVLEALYGAEYGGAWTHVSRADFERFDQLRRLPLEPMAIGIELYAGADCIVAASTAEGPEVEVMFGSHEQQALAFAEGAVADPWQAGLWQ